MPEATHKPITPRRKPAGDVALIALCDRLDRVDQQYEAFTSSSADLYGADLPAAVERKQGRFSARVTRLQRQISAIPASTCIGLAAKARAVRRAFTEMHDGSLMDDMDGLLASLTTDLIGNSHIQEGGRV